MTKSDIGLNQTQFIARIDNYSHTKGYHQRVVMDSTGVEYLVVAPNRQDVTEKTEGISGLLRKLDLDGEWGLSKMLREETKRTNKPNLETFENNYRILQAYFGQKDVIGEIQNILKYNRVNDVSRERAHITLKGLATIAPETLMLNLWQHENAGRNRYDLNLTSLKKLPLNAEKHIFYI